MPLLEFLEDRCVPAGNVTITAFTVPQASEGMPSNPSVSAAFTDTAGLAATALTATVNYGDGTALSTATISKTGATTYTVTDTHTFPEESGSTVPPFAFTVTLHVFENATPAANTDTQTQQGFVLDAPLSMGNPVAVGGGTTFFGGNTGNAASAATAFANFKAAVGGPDVTTATGPQASGFRTINWDGVKTDGTDLGGPPNTTVITGHTVGIPLNRFQTRGVYFGAIYGVSNDGFVDVNPSVAGLFPAFSPLNTFAMFNDNGIDFKFVVPSAVNTTVVSAASRGFGAIFLNVQQPGTTITFFNGSTVLDTLNVPTNATAGATEFAGELFNSAEVTNVLLTLGAGVIFKFDGTTVTAGGANSATNNLVAVDDFVYPEPVAIANGFPIVSGGAGTGNAKVSVNATEGTAFTGVVASFSDSDPAGNAKDFTATINWGDGHSTNGKITANAAGGFDVSGTNTYVSVATFPISVDVADFGGGPGQGGSQPTLAVTNTAKVADAALQATAVPVTVASGLVVNNALVATFTDTGGAKDLKTYTAAIDWGDGTTPTAGSITVANGTFSVTGFHSYAAAGTFNVTVTVLDFGGATATVSTTATVAGNPAPSEPTLNTPNQRFVDQVFEALLDRHADSQSLQLFSGLLDAGFSPVILVQAILQSPEYLTDQVEGLYGQFLHRAADSSGLAAGVLFLEAGGNPAQLAALLIGSPEYFSQRGGGSNDGFVTALFADAFGVPPTAAQRSLFDNELALGTPPFQVALQVLSTPH